jgi:Flp pilus assembly protein TadB
MTLITVLGILITLLVIVISVEFMPVVSRSRAARTLGDMHVANTEEALPGWRQVLSPLDTPVARRMPSRLLRKAQADLYWAQMDNKWQGWDTAQFTVLRLALTVGGVIVGLVVFGELLLALVVGFLGWQFPAMSAGGTARRMRRRFQAQLPEYIQLVAAQMAAGVSLDEALKRTSSAEGLVPQWVRQVIQMAQGRSVLPQMQAEAQRSLLPELISMAVQLEFIRRGAAQQELLGQLANRIAADYIASAEQRAEKIGAELVIPMVLFYFLPFTVAMLAIIGWPIVAGMFI